MSLSPSSAGFPTTCWSNVFAAGGPAAASARSALEELCRDYWYPIYAFVRRKGYDPETAQDMVQGLFVSLLERDNLHGLEPSRGRFRSFLMACCTHYLSNCHERDRAVKRGGGRTIISLGALNPEARFDGEPAHELSAERLFERRWALTLLDNVLAGLDVEMAGSDRQPLYVRLRPSLLGHDEAQSYRAIALEMGQSEGAVKTAAHRFRIRYRERLREEIARTIADPADIDDEIKALLNSLSR
jgi:RNA polymerase sigma factor (sigma-70 family)